MAYEGWVWERGTDPPVWCPVDDEGRIVIGLSIIADEPPGESMGSFWYDEGGLQVDPFDAP